jgi:AcrR family transcriptional regulator
VDRIDQPQNARSRRTRTALLDSALALARTEGAEAVTMERLAAEAGVSRRGAYLHFASRTDLFVALRAHVDEQFDLAASIRPMQEATGLGEMVDAWARHVATYHHQIMPLVRMIDLERRTDPDAQALHDESMEAWMAGCRAFAGAAAASGQLAPPWDVDSTADLLWALMGVELLEDLVEDRGWSEEAYAQRLALVARRTLLRDPEIP